MKKIVLLFSLLLPLASIGQKLYSKAFGKSDNLPIIFIHGGPSGNSSLFEYTTAEKLAKKGYYVIVYDRRGEGRSNDSLAKFTYAEYFDDLNTIYNTFHLKKANLLSHSFGSLVATLFTEKYPEKVASLILAGGLFSQQETYNNILESVTEIHLKSNNKAQISKIKEVKNLNKNSAKYRKDCYALASNVGFFDMPKPTKNSIKLRENYKNSIAKNNIRNNNAPIQFYKNEPLKNIDTKSTLFNLKNQINIYALYGKDDKIFGNKQMTEIKNIVGKNNFSLIDNCSHYLFVDQQEIFINKLDNWLKK